MIDELLDYVLNLDDPDQRRALESRLRSDPDAARGVAVLKRFVKLLAADQEPPTPPPDLVARTIGRVAEYLCQNEGKSAGSPSPLEELTQRMSPERWRNIIEVLDRASAAPTRARRADWLVAGSIFAVAVGLLFAGIPYLRDRNDVLACQNQMRQMYQGFETYANLHDGKYPQVGIDPNYQTAGSFLAILRDSGSLPNTGVYACPATQPKRPASYAYTLGYRADDGSIVPLRHSDAQGTDSLAVLADRPLPERVGPNPDHRYGENILFMGGNVRFSTTTFAGPDLDDIYRNRLGLIAAGVDNRDVVLGMGSDMP